MDFRLAAIVFLALAFVLTGTFAKTMFWKLVYELRCFSAVAHFYSKKS